MTATEFLILMGMILVGLLFFMVARNFILGEEETTEEYGYKAEAKGLVSLIERVSSETSEFILYCQDISLCNINVKNGILTYERGNVRYSYPVPKSVNDISLVEIATFCISKSKKGINLLGEKPACIPDNVCVQDECKEDCPDCYGPNSKCIGDTFCNNLIGESCLNSVDCKCDPDRCCPSSPDADKRGCSIIKNIEKGKECWCTSQCEGGLECNPTYPTFAGYNRACCDPGKGWDGGQCENLICPDDNKCPGAPMGGGPGDNAWVDSNGIVCCPFNNIDDTSGPICSNKHCCPTHKPKWCERPKTGSPRCMDQNEYDSEGCKPTMSCESIKSPSDLPKSWDWRNVNGRNWNSLIRDQGSCGSCWSFSAISAVEGTYNIEQNTPGANTDLSEQNLVSCPGGGGSCSGGWHYLALGYIKSSGVCDEACFPYRAANVPCNRCGDYTSRLWKINDYKSISGDFEIKKMLVCNGPLSIALTFIPHAVGLVGYDDTKSEWIIKNSWGVINGYANGIRHENGYGYVPYGTIYYNYYVEGVNAPS